MSELAAKLKLIAIGAPKNLVTYQFFESSSLLFRTLNFYDWETFLFSTNL